MAAKAAVRQNAFHDLLPRMAVFLDFYNFSLKFNRMPVDGGIRDQDPDFLELVRIYENERNYHEMMKVDKK